MELLHPRFRGRLTDDQADTAGAMVPAWRELRSALDYEERCFASWTLRVMTEGRRSPAALEAWQVLQRAGERREAAAAAVEDAAWRLDESLAVDGQSRQSA
ncbi:hypothetical protein NR798_24190 [Archangium gephyra]|uniref:hypothetical protein n=1 Tax=Archangium gephyra TaxID=48 RepID=UPI0035D46BDD